jgi:ribosomal protein S18 acetylase RimI-like enzyme
VAGLTLREAKATDARAIAQVHVAAWRAAYRGMMPDAYLAALSVEERVERWTNAIVHPGPAKVAVAVLDGQVAGFCSFGPTRDTDDLDVAEIYSLNIFPPLWGRGAGRMLCEHAFREAAARGHEAVTLWVLKENDRARRFYEGLGYAPDGAEKTDTALIGSPLNDVRYRKAIKAG